MKELTLKSGKTISLNQAFNMDCLEFMPELPDKCIDMILCDLPYGTTACKWDVIIPFEPLWEQYERIIKDNGAIVLTASQPFTSALIMSNISDFKYTWVWDKVLPTGHLNSKIMPLRGFEDVCVFGVNKIKYNPQKTTGHNRKIARTVYTKKGEGEQVYGKEDRDTFYDSSERYPTGIIRVSSANQTEKIHPTQKPIPLFEYFIETYSNPDDIVLDNCSGSLTTGVAAYNTGRNWIACEKDEQIFDAGNERYEQETKQMLMEF